jgi:hypothetical protein
VLLGLGSDPPTRIDDTVDSKRGPCVGIEQSLTGFRSADPRALRIFGDCLTEASNLKKFAFLRLIKSKFRKVHWTFRVRSESFLAD